MKLFGKHVFPRQVALFAAGYTPSDAAVFLVSIFLGNNMMRCSVCVCMFGRLVFFGATTYDVHRSIKNNEQPPTKEQMEALQDYINSKRH